MTYNIIFSEHAEKEFDTLDRSIQQGINTFIEKLIDCNDPCSQGAPLEENFSSYCTFRVGDYRMIAEIQEDISVVLVLAVGHIHRKDRSRLLD